MELRSVRARGTAAALLLFGLLSCGGASAAELSLEDCLAVALETHPSLMGAAGRRLGAETTLETLRVNDRVTVSATGAVRYNGSLDDTDDRYHSESAGITASKLLYDTGKNRLRKEAQKETIQGMKENERYTRVSVAASVKRAYFKLVLSILNQGVETERLNNFLEHLKTAQGLYDVGKSPFIDVTQAEANAADARVSLLKAENDVQVSREALYQAMGARTEDAAEPTTALSLPQSAGDAEGLIATDLEERPDYLQALSTLRVRELGVRSAARTSSPSITATAGPSFSNSENSSSSTNYSVGVSVNIPVADGGLAAAEVMTAKGQVYQASADVESLRNDIAYGVRSAALSLTNAVDRAESAEKSVRYAEENLELARGRYEVGVGSPLELSDAVSSLASARYARYQALYDAQAARADLDEAIGRLPSETEGMEIKEINLREMINSKSDKSEREQKDREGKKNEDR